MHRLKQACIHCALFTLLGIFLGSVSGCGGDTAVPLPPPATASQKVDDEPLSPREQAAMNKSKKTDGKTEPAQAARPPASVIAAAKPAIEIPSIPKDVHEWQERDFIVARFNNDPRFATALEERSKKPQGTIEEAEMIAALFQATPPHDLQDAITARKPPPDLTTSQWQALVVLLSHNKEQAARETLEKLVRGEISTKNRVNMADFVPRTLLEANLEENEQLFLKCLCSPDGLLSSSNVAGKLGPLRPAVNELLRTSASARLRLSIAEAYAEHKIPTPYEKQILAILSEPVPSNAGSQIYLYQKAELEPVVRTSLEKRFSATSSDSMRHHFLLVPTASTLPPALNKSDLEATLLLWNPTFVELLDLQQRSLTTMAQRPSAFVLGATIPTDAARSSLRRSLARHWAEGPNALLNSSLQETISAEPGCIVALKVVARENRPAKKPATPANAKGKTAPAKADRNVTQNGDGNDDWDKFTLAVIQDYCRRCHVAALSRSAALLSTGESSDSKNAASESKKEAVQPPLTLRKEDDVIASYQGEFPGDGASVIPLLAKESLRVGYWRIEERAKPIQIQNYYSKQTKPNVERAIPGGMWYDHLSETDEKKRIRSIDVLVSYPNKKNDRFRKGRNAVDD